MPKTNASPMPPSRLQVMSLEQNPPAMLDIPDWALALCALLDSHSPVSPIAPAIASGQVKFDDSLQFVLGISPIVMMSLSGEIGQLVQQYKTVGSPTASPTPMELSKTKTIGALMHLVHAYLGSKP